MNNQTENEINNGMLHGFHKIPDGDTFSRMTDIELAAWQAAAANNSDDITGAILANKEWQRREQGKQHELNTIAIELQHQRNIDLIKEQVKWVKFSAVLTAVSTLTAAITGSLVTFMLTRQSPQQMPKAEIPQTVESKKEQPNSASRFEKATGKAQSSSHQR